MTRPTVRLTGLRIVATIPERRPQTVARLAGDQARPEVAATVIGASAKRKRAAQCSVQSDRAGGIGGGIWVQAGSVSKRGPPDDRYDAGTRASYSWFAQLSLSY